MRRIEQQRFPPNDRERQDKQARSIDASPNEAWFNKAPTAANAAL
jgi:hypothetical protein